MAQLSIQVDPGVTTAEKLKVQVWSPDDVELRNSLQAMDSRIRRVGSRQRIARWMDIEGYNQVVMSGKAKGKQISQMLFWACLLVVQVQELLWACGFLLTDC